MEVEDIFKHYNVKLNTIQNKYEVFLEKTCINAADHIEELLKFQKLVYLCVVVYIIQLLEELD